MCVREKCVGGVYAGSSRSSKIWKQKLVNYSTGREKKRKLDIHLFKEKMPESSFSIAYCCLIYSIRFDSVRMARCMLDLFFFSTYNGLSTLKAHTNLNVTKLHRFHSEVPILITLANWLISVLNVALVVVVVKLAAAVVELTVYVVGLGQH